MSELPTSREAPVESCSDARTSLRNDPLVDPVTGKRFNAALQGPVTHHEPDFLHQLPMDNAVGAIMALTAEVWMLRERLAALEAELEARKVLPAGAVENHRDTAAAAETRAADLAAYTARVMSELTRNREPVSHIDPAVQKFL
ncbi:MAG: hypothetical protein FJ179_04305 [Gammaproteobacteria bacterium]|nr:hypothetical protein [Gammaproteobacteria bacterium]